MANEELAAKALKLPDTSALSGITGELPTILEYATKVADFVSKNAGAIPVLASIAGPAKLIDEVLHVVDGIVHVPA